MYDVKQWLDECAVPNLSGHIYRHQFKIVRGPGGKARFFYKKWSTSGTWYPEEGIKLIQRKPKGVPKLIEPEKSKLNLEKLRQDIPKYHLHFDSETIKWWEEFLDSEGPVPSVGPEWMLPKLRRQPVAQPAQLQTNPNQDVSESLTRLVEREEREVEVWHWL